MKHHSVTRILLFVSLMSSLLLSDSGQAVYAQVPQKHKAPQHAAKAPAMKPLAPMVVQYMTGTMGNEGWYVSDVTIVYARQGDSVVSESQTNVLKLTDDGVHQIPVYDNFGGQATQIIKIDKTGPQISWVEMPDGMIASGKWFNITGDSVDNFSMPGEVDISYDNGQTWVILDLPAVPGVDHFPDSGWTFIWDTRKVPNGNYTIQARSRDVAGNWSQTISLAVRVKN